jgi:cruciform cutting endonuclease 1
MYNARYARVPRTSCLLTRGQRRLLASGARDDQLSRLKSLKGEQLVRLAIACGTPCSGTKDVLSRGLLNALSSCTDAAEGTGSGRTLSVVSIDMGIRNLAYCHVQTDLEVAQRQVRTIKLGTWHRIDISTGAFHALDSNKPTAVKGNRSLLQVAETMDGPHSPLKESFEPTEYAAKAYQLASQLLQMHSPTHILVERQRFRSGGGPAVQEWTLRVGMFEYMLYATLHTLKARGVHSSVVVPVLPPAVNRYWLAELEQQGIMPDKKPTSAAMKKFKIGHVRTIIESREAVGHQIEFSTQPSQLADAFLSSSSGVKRAVRTQSLPKLDDLSDCLLQGLGWISWQNSRGRLQTALQRGVQEVVEQFGL